MSEPRGSTRGEASRPPAQPARPQSPRPAARARRGGGPEALRVVHVRRDRERLGVPALHEQRVEEAAVAQPDVGERPPVAVALLRAEPVADLGARREQPLDERRRLGAEALGRPWTSGVSIPISRTRPSPESRMVSPSVTLVTVARARPRRAVPQAQGRSAHAPTASASSAGG